MLFSYAKFDFNVLANALNICWHCDGGFLGGAGWFRVVPFVVLIFMLQNNFCYLSANGKTSFCLNALHKQSK